MQSCFIDELEKSRDAIRKLPLEDMLRRYFPNLIRLKEAEDERDIEGSDLLATLPHREVGIDVKLRQTDPRERGTDDLAIEVSSVYEKCIPGYQNSRVDYLLWVFETTQRTVLIPFSPFKARYEQNIAEWAYWGERFNKETLFRNGQRYHSTYCIVPYSELADLVISQQSAIPTQDKNRE
ncbi:hypothetical protein [Pelagicoccus mobilis]|uniref:Uncharacterized protein n=1 Tax=Pelagicoccus mobilis TaxID=415221 RepID=A0A934RXB4_9BACT|nr:hypothetical protein [Pelagicoccus mobilis]MBK1876087.1 hypothetical protein [Pelagicoccus mobilis]